MTSKEGIDSLTKALEKEKAITAKGVWEKYAHGKKYVLTVHGLLCGDIPILMSKFILWADENGVEISNTLTWLYDLKCVYRDITFSDADGLDKLVKKITSTCLFGDELKKLSKITLLGCAEKLNETISKKTDGISVYSFVYQPLHSVVPCEATSYDFNVNINGTNDIGLSLKKENSWTLTASAGEYIESKDMGYIDSFIDTATELILKISK